MREAAPCRDGYLQVVGLGPDGHMQAVELGQAWGSWPVAAHGELQGVVYLGPTDPGEAQRKRQLEGLGERTCARTGTPFQLLSALSGRWFVLTG